MLLWWNNFCRIEGRASLEVLTFVHFLSGASGDCVTLAPEKTLLPYPDPDHPVDNPDYSLPKFTLHTRLVPMPTTHIETASMEGKLQRLETHNKNLINLINKERVKNARVRKRLAKYETGKSDKDNLVNWLSKYVTGAAKDVIVNEIKNSDKEPKQRRYNDNLKLLCLAVKHQSPKAYRFLCKIFKFPSESTQWSRTRYCVELSLERNWNSDFHEIWNPYSSSSRVEGNGWIEISRKISENGSYPSENLSPLSLKKGPRPPSNLIWSFRILLPEVLYYCKIIS